MFRPRGSSSVTKLKCTGTGVGFIQQHVFKKGGKECDDVYIDETKRTLKIRLGEHNSAVKRGDPKNGIAVRAHETKHAINWDEARVRGCVKGFWQRKTTEAIHIQHNKKAMNLDRGLCLPSVWNPILNPP